MSAPTATDGLEAILISRDYAPIWKLDGSSGMIGLTVTCQRPISAT
jgi:hypothetical protein